MDGKTCIRIQASYRIKTTMIKKGLLLSLLIVAGLSWMPCLAAQLVEHVFIISFDGGGGAPGMIEKNEQMHCFHQMVKEGASTWTARTTKPSITLPSHTSMLTGVGPEKHKILWNKWEPEKGLVSVPTVFSLAKAQGLGTAMFVGKEKFKHLKLPGSVDTFVWPHPKSDAKAVAAAVGRLLAQTNPSICFIHFADPDSIGHKFGWGSVQQEAALLDCDEALTQVRTAIAAAGMESSSVIILTADHGGHEKGHGTEDPVDMNIPWVAWGKGVKKGMHLIAPITTYDTAATALWLLGVRIPADWDGTPIKEAFSFQ